MPDYPKTDTDRLSVSAWVSAFGPAGWASIVANWSDLTPQPGLIGQFALGVDPGRHLLAGILEPGGTPIIVLESGKDLPRGRWQHVALVADGAMLRLYRNAVEVGSRSYHGISREPLPNGLGIGLQTDPSGAKPHTPPWGFWDGRLDEIAIFNHALSAEQIRQLCVGSAETSMENRRTPER